MYLSEQLDHLVAMLEIDAIGDDPMLNAAIAIKERVMHEIMLAYGLLFYDNPDAAMENLKQLLTVEEQDAGMLLTGTDENYVEDEGEYLDDSDYARYSPEVFDEE